MSELCLTIPCEVAGKPDHIGPELVYLGPDWSGPSKSCRPDFTEKCKKVPAARVTYQCPFCGGRGPSRRSIAGHMGMISNEKPNCRFLVNQDRERRLKNS